MRRFLLIIALALMGVSATSPLWVGWTRRGDAVRRYQRVMVSGRVVGEFSESPWEGTVVSLGTETKPLAADGTFSFAALPGVHILRVCCSKRFQSIYREVSVDDKDVHLELTAEPLREIAGRVLTPTQKPIREALKVSMKLVGTNRRDRGVVYSNGTFFFHLIKGDWQVELENLSEDHKLESITLDGREISDGKFTISSVKGPSLPLRITLK